MWPLPNTFLYCNVVAYNGANGIRGVELVTDEQNVATANVLSQ